MRVGGYSLDLYCDRLDVKHGEVTDRFGHRYNEFPHQFLAETGTQCDRAARAKGWHIGPHRVLCPKCSGKRKPKTPTTGRGE